MIRFADYIAAEQHLSNVTRQMEKKRQLIEACLCSKDNIEPWMVELLHDFDQLELELNANKVTEDDVEDATNRVEDAMHCLLASQLPKALMKREFEHYDVMTDVERILITGVIPYIEKHETWEMCEKLVRTYLDRIDYGHCRACGLKPKKQIECSTCKRAIFCSNRCLMIDLKDKTLGHKVLECESIHNHEVVRRMTKK